MYCVSKQVNTKSSKGDFTGGQRKILAFMVDLCRNEQFYRAVKQIRNKYNLPESGVNLFEEGYFVDEWPKKDISSDIAEELKREAYGLAKISNSGMLQLYPEVFLSLVAYDVVYIPGYIDFAYIEEKRKLKSVLTEKQIDTVIKKEFPITIKISAYASQNEIIDFIENNYETYIKPIQNKNKDKKSKLGSLRLKKDQELLDTVYENSEKTAGKLMSLVADIHGVIYDPGNVSKKRSIENNLRNQRII
jgi:hypothetical protein